MMAPLLTEGHNLNFNNAYATVCSFLGSGQTKGFCPLLDVFISSIYWIFRATQNANRWRIINQMFAKSLPLDARVKKYC